MWQDVLSAIDHQHASEFVQLYCRLFVLPNQATHHARHCQPQANWESGEMERSHDARLVSLFSKTEIMVLRFYHAVHGHGSKD